METAKMYQELGISPEVYQYGEAILQGLKDRFEAIDAVAEYNPVSYTHLTLPTKLEV